MPTLTPDVNSSEERWNPVNISQTALPKDLILRAAWGGRNDSVDRQIDMLGECMARLGRYGGFLADQWEGLLDGSWPVSRSREELCRYVQAVLEDPEDYNGYGLTQSRGYPDEDPPCTTMSATLIGKRGGMRRAANDVVAVMETGKNMADAMPLPVGWLLGLGRALVMDFVEIWQPDAVSLDSDELLDLRPMRGSSWPVIGYVSWLADDVWDETVPIPEAPLRERWAGGTLIGIDPCVPDPVGAASDLAERVYATGGLRMIPPIQHQVS